jgi:hypothetical protein
MILHEMGHRGQVIATQKTPYAPEKKSLGRARQLRRLLTALGVGMLMAGTSALRPPVTEDGRAFPLSECEHISHGMSAADIKRLLDEPPRTEQVGQSDRWQYFMKVREAGSRRFLGAIPLPEADTFWTSTATVDMQDGRVVGTKCSARSQAATREVTNQSVIDADAAQVSTIMAFFKYLEAPTAPAVFEAAKVLGGLREMEEGMSPAATCGMGQGGRRGTQGMEAGRSLVFCCLRKHARSFHQGGVTSVSWPPQEGPDGLRVFRVKTGDQGGEVRFEFSQTESTLDNVYLADGRTLQDVLSSCIEK